MTNVIN